MSITADAVASLAPDAASLAAGKKTSDPRHWTGLGRSDGAFWGECRGSAVYQVRVALIDLAAKCSCPSRKFPCKHALGLMLLYAQSPQSVPVGAEPAWVSEWLSKRGETAQRKKEKAEKVAAAPPPDPEDAAKRSAKRTARVLAGLDALERWLGDLVRNGVASVPPGDRAWGEQAARLVDAQAPGLASRLRDLGSLPRVGAWAERMTDGLGRLALLAHATRRLDALEPALAADVRAAVGWTLERNDVLAGGDKVRDHWLVLGQIVEDDDRVIAQRTWLRGRDTGRHALVVQFATGAARFPEVLLPGTMLEAELAFWPGAARVRALVSERVGSPVPITQRPPGAHDSVEACLTSYARALGAQPFLDRHPVALAGVVPTVRLDGEGAALHFVVDQDGRALPLAGPHLWSLFAMAGGQPVDVFGEWDGWSLRPAGLFSQDRFHPFVSALSAPTDQEAA